MKLLHREDVEEAGYDMPSTGICARITEFDLEELKYAGEWVLADDEVVVAEIDADLVSAVRGNQNRYTYNVASADGRAAVTVEGVELLNPQDAGQSARLKEILGRSTEVVTALPSVAFYDRGKPSVAARIAGALKAGDASATAVYTAENHNHAAEILDEKIAAVQTDAITARPMRAARAATSHRSGRVRRAATRRWSRSHGWTNTRP